MCACLAFVTRLRLEEICKSNFVRAKEKFQVYYFFICEFFFQVFIKSELKVGVIYVKEGQYTEEEILDNNENSPLFDDFLQILGEKIRLKGFDKYKGGLDTVQDLTGLYSNYTHWRGIEIMFHVSTLLPYEKNDPQKVCHHRPIFQQQQ